MTPWSTSLYYAGIGIVVFGLIVGAMSFWMTNRINEIRTENERELQERVRTAEQQATEALEQQRPREITQEQRDAFLAFVRDKPKGRIKLWAVAGDRESIRFARELEQLLIEAGFTCEGVTPGVFLPDTPVGITLDTHDRANVPPHALVIQQGLQLLGLDAVGHVIQAVDPGSIELRVGQKPPP